VLLLSERLHLGPSRARSFLSFDFQVPPRIRTLKTRLRFSPARIANIRNLITVSLYDRSGFRGAGHRHEPEQVITLSLYEASAGFVPGPLVPGRWTVELALHAVLPSLTGGVDCVLEIDAEEDTEAVDAEEDVPVAEPTEPQEPDEPYPALPRQPTWYSDLPEGWLKGDLHLHSNHSDARWTVEDIVEHARRHQLDFLALTDHNTITGRKSLRRALDNAGLSVVVLNGLELTTFWGHANVLGIDRWIDWRMVGPGKLPTPLRDISVGEQGTWSLGTRTVSQVADEVHHRRGLFVVNHPRSAGYPQCTGCRWEYDDDTADIADLIEVMNGPWLLKQNEQALQLWDRWLNLGHRIPATAGTDSHGFSRHPEQLGFTYVRAEPTHTSILNAVKSGRSFLSRGPSVMWCEPDAGEPVRPDTESLLVRVGGLTGTVDVCLVAGGKRIGRERIEVDSDVEFKLDDEARRRTWFRVEIYPKGKKELLALTNPLFADVEAGR
jgi:hypothetical protein